MSEIVSEEGRKHERKEGRIRGSHYELSLNRALFESLVSHAVTSNAAAAATGKATKWQHVAFSVVFDKLLSSATNLLAPSTGATPPPSALSIVRPRAQSSHSM